MALVQYVKRAIKSIRSWCSVAQSWGTELYGTGSSKVLTKVLYVDKCSTSTHLFSSIYLLSASHQVTQFLQCSRFRILCSSDQAIGQVWEWSIGQVWAMPVAACPLWSSTELGSKSSSHADCGCVSMFGSGPVFLLFGFCFSQVGRCQLLIGWHSKLFCGRSPVGWWVGNRGKARQKLGRKNSWLLS